MMSTFSALVFYFQVNFQGDMVSRVQIDAGRTRNYLHPIGRGTSLVVVARKSTSERFLLRHISEAVGIQTRCKNDCFFGKCFFFAVYILSSNLQS